MLDVLCRAVLVLVARRGAADAGRGHGAIVNVSSVAGFVPMGTYSAAKAWCTAFTEGLAHELAGTGVTATALCPGFTHTEFHQRADLDMSRLPDFLWLEADRLVRDCLDDVAAGQGGQSCRALQYKVLTGVLQVLPRGLVRRASGTVASLRRRRG